MSWIEDIQGYRTILDAAGNPIKRRQTVQILGATAVDDGTKSVITVPPGATGATGATGPSGATALRGVGLTVDASGLLRPRHRARKLQYSDWFATGGTASGTIGRLGWQKVDGAGTGTVARVNGSPGFYNLALAAGTNNRSAFCLGGSATGQVGTPSTAGEALDLLQAVVRLSTLTQTRFFFGFSDDATNMATPARALGILFDSGISATNWLTWGRNAAAGAPANSGVAAAAGTFALLSIIRSGSNYAMYVGSTLLSTVTTNIPSTGCNISLGAERLNASVGDLDVRFFYWESADLTGAFDDDSMLEA